MSPLPEGHDEAPLTLPPRLRMTLALLCRYIAVREHAREDAGGGAHLPTKSRSAGEYHERSG